MICFCHERSVSSALTICFELVIVKMAGNDSSLDGSSVATIPRSLTCNGVSQECFFSLTIFPSLYIVKVAITYTFHGSLRRFRMPCSFRSLRASRLSSAVDRSRGPLMPVLLVCALVSAGKYQGFLSLECIVQ